MSWINDCVEFLKKFWSEGLSVSQIVGELGGVICNVVIGKVYCLGLFGCVKIIIQSVKLWWVCLILLYVFVKKIGLVLQIYGLVVFKIDVVLVLIVKLELVVEFVVEFILILKWVMILIFMEWICKWLIGDFVIDDFYFCGCQFDVGVLYCVYYCKIVYQLIVDCCCD